jgi:hypothetical protein
LRYGRVDVTRRVRVPASRLLLPRSGLERSDFVPWHETDMPERPGDV